VANFFWATLNMSCTLILLLCLNNVKTAAYKLRVVIDMLVTHVARGSAIRPTDRTPLPV